MAVAASDELMATVPTPYYCVWEITLACNLKCTHCGSRAGRPRPRELSTGEALHVVEQLADLGVHDVTLIGGEAFLRDDWDVLVRAIRDRGMVPSMATGGRGFSPERVRRAKSAGIDTVGVSVDGLEQTHDGLRGVQGSWRSAMEAIDNLRTEGVRVTANSQMNRRNLADLDALCDVLLARGIAGWQVQHTTAMGRAAEVTGLVFQPYDMLEVIPLVARLKRRCEAAGIDLVAADGVGYFGPYEADLRRRGARALHWEGCGAGTTVIGIESDGTLKGCLAMPTAEYGAGSCLERPLAELWASSALEERRGPGRDGLWGFCAECYYAEVCRAGCTATTHALLGRSGNNPYCYHRAETLKARGRREVLVPAGRAPGRPFDHGIFELIEETVA